MVASKGGTVADLAAGIPGRAARSSSGSVSRILAGASEKLQTTSQASCAS